VNKLFCIVLIYVNIYIDVHSITTQQSKGYQPPLGWPIQQLSSLADQQSQVDRVIKILKRVLADKKEFLNDIYQVFKAPIAQSPHE
jgi:hypothetical protein